MFARLTGTGNRSFIAEILMIVVGINIALWFEGYFDDLKDAETERQYLAGLKEDLLSDIDALDRIIAINERTVENLEKIIPSLDGLRELAEDTQAQIVFTPSSYQFFEPSDFTYQSMQESGDFRLLSDDVIKTGLLRLAREYRFIDTLQDNFIQAMDDEYIPLVMRSFDLVTQRITSTDLVDDQVFRNFFPYALQDTGSRVEAYRRTRDLSREVLDRLESRLAAD